MQTIKVKSSAAAIRIDKEPIVSVVNDIPSYSTGPHIQSYKFCICGGLRISASSSLTTNLTSVSFSFPIHILCNHPHYFHLSNILCHRCFDENIQYCFL